MTLSPNPSSEELEEQVKLTSMVGQLFATSATDEQLKLRLVKNIRALIDAARNQGELKGLDLIENSPRVPVELMSAVIERKKELKQPRSEGERS